MHHTQILMQQAWMEIMGPKTSCSLIHPQTLCPTQVVIKCITVLKSSSKMYTALYLVMFAIQFKKLKQQGKIKRTIFKYGKDFIFSLAFMSWMVGGMKTALCLLNAAGSPLDIRIIPLLSLLGSVSVFFNDKTKMSQISYFTFVRSCRSAYVFFKKRWAFPFKRQKQFFFVLIIVMISYLYFEGDQNLKNRNLLKNWWGEV